MLFPCLVIKTRKLLTYRSRSYFIELKRYLDKAS